MSTQSKKQHRSSGPGLPIIRTTTGEQQLYFPPLLETQVEYPSKWFEDNKGKKPPLLVRLTKGGTLETARAKAYAVANGSSTVVSDAVEYLYRVFGTITDTLNADWVSYDVTIKKGTVSPLSLLEISIIEDRPETLLSTPVTLPPSDDLGLTIYLAGLTRIAKSNEKQREKIAERIAPLITAVVSKEFTAKITNHYAIGSSLITMQEIDTLLAALDMFLDRFPRHSFSKCRMGTILSRHFGFSAFQDLRYFANMIGAEDEAKALEWFFTPASGKELDQMVCANEEFNIQYSYLPYAISMRLSNKSPFAAVTNPNVHFIVHIVGSLYGNIRSINAQKGPNVQLGQGAMNACIIFLRHAQLGMFIPQYLTAEKYNTTKEKIKKYIQRRSGKSNDNEDRLADPMDAALAFNDGDLKFTPDEIEIIKDSASKITEVRDGSVGEWVRDHLVTSLPRLNDTELEEGEEDD